MEELEIMFGMDANAVFDDTHSESAIATRSHMRKRRWLSSSNSDDDGDSGNHKPSRSTINSSSNGSRHEGYSSENMLSDIEGSSEWRTSKDRQVDANKYISDHANAPQASKEEITTPGIIGQH